MAGIYHYGDFSVTVNDDHSIRVRPGDWISKYADAIYKIPNMQSYWKRFKRKVNGQFVELTDYAKIDAGEVIWHPDPLPPPDVRIGKPSQPDAPAPAEQVDPGRVEEFFDYIRRALTPVSGWKFMDAQGADLGAGPFAANYSAIQVRQLGHVNPTWFHAVGGGFGLGTKWIVASGSFSFPGDFSAGFVAKFPSAGPTLSVDELCGSYALLDVSVGWRRGRSLGLLFFGLNTPWDLYIHMLRYLRGEGPFPAMIPRIFTGVIGMWGHSWSSPNAGFSIKTGTMHRWDCITPW